MLSEGDSHVTTNGADAYFVVCSNGFMRGQFGKDLSDMRRCAVLRNELCTCGGTHRIIRMVQTGEGCTVPK